MTPDPNPYKIALDIRRELDAITALYPASIKPSQSSDHTGTHSSNPRDVLAAHVIDVRAAVRRDLRNHCRDVAREVEASTYPTGDVKAQCGFLIRWAVPYSEQDVIGADELAKSLRRHARQLRALVTGDRTRVIPIGRCPVTVWVDPDDLGAGVERCHGELVAKFQKHGRPREVICDNRPDLHVWTAGTWHTLGQEITLEAALEQEENP